MRGLTRNVAAMNLMVPQMACCSTASVQKSYFKELPYIIVPMKNPPPDAAIAGPEETIEDDGSTIKTDLHHATGLELGEVKQRLAGAEDPFGMRGGHRKGTKENPVMVPTSYGMRIIGCAGDEDSTAVAGYYQVPVGKLMRCSECGNAFKTYDGEPAPLYMENDH